MTPPPTPEPLSPDEWRQVAQLFENAVDLPPSERAAFLDRPGLPPRIRAELDRMLAADLEAAAFLEQDPLPEWSQPSFAPTAGALVGPYQLLRELGSGGMASVWLAERADPSFSQQVAIKFSKAGLVSAGAERRLRSERRILAQLQHPHIARLLDGGAVGPGVPYLVMEYVDGEPLLAYVQSHNLPLPDRLRLFIDICHAVHFAHQRLIVHRDLKPANILVDRSGRVRLLDFGVAKLLQTDADPDTGEAPATVAAFCTPAYASPEQLHGQPVTTVSDIYSLGRILYELLANQRVPSLPSLEPPVPGDVNPTIDRDLDSIVRFALQPEPDHRYPSVRALAEDLERYLEGHPVSAQPNTVLYRSVKFVRRHRALTAILTVALALLAWQWRETRRAQQVAQRHLEDLHRLALHLLFDYHDEVSRLPGSTALRARIAADSVSYLNRLALDVKSEQTLAGLSQDIAQAYLRLGDVQGRPWSANQGDTAAALRSYRQAEDWATHSTLLRATALQRQGQVEARLHDWSSALRHLSSATALLRSATTNEEKLQRVSATSALGDAYIRSGSAEGLRLHREALGYARAMPASIQATSDWIRLTAVIEQRLGNYLAAHGSPAEALAHHRAALAAFDAQLRLKPDNPWVLRDFADQLVMKAEAQARAGDRAGAIADCDRGIALFERLLHFDPANVEARRDLGYAWYNRVVAASTGGPPDCPGTQKALALFEALHAQSQSKEDEESAFSLRNRLKACPAPSAP